MEPSYVQGSRVIAQRLAYLAVRPERGDVVVIRSPEARARLELKRIVGLPGETVCWQRGRLSVNGRELEEPYAMSPPVPPGDDAPSVWRLGRREYFVAGDNRLYSRDSRVYGPVRRSAIVGKIVDSGTRYGS